MKVSEFTKYQGFFDTGKKLRTGEAVYCIVNYFVVEKDYSSLVEPTEKELDEIAELMKQLH